eukprot:g16147.t1
MCLYWMSLQVDIAALQCIVAVSHGRVGHLELVGQIHVQLVARSMCNLWPDPCARLRAETGKEPPCTSRFG